MNVHIVHDGAGAISGVHRTVDGAAHHLVAHDSNAVLPSGDALTIEGLDAALDENPIVKVSYSGNSHLLVERHAVVL
jgi:hypothetical protein